MSDSPTPRETYSAQELLPLVYAELRRLAASRLSRESAVFTLQPTALVHETYLRLTASHQDRPWNSRAHFFGAAAEAMRRILIDAARKRQTEKHGAGLSRVPLVDDELFAVELPEELLALDEALGLLEQVDEQAAGIVKLRYFTGMTIPEAAEVLGVSPRRADALWAYARAWLLDRLREPIPPT